MRYYCSTTNSQLKPQIIQSKVTIIIFILLLLFSHFIIVSSYTAKGNYSHCPIDPFNIYIQLASIEKVPYSSPHTYICMCKAFVWSVLSLKRPLRLINQTEKQRSNVNLCVIYLYTALSVYICNTSAACISACSCLQILRYH